MKIISNAQPLDVANLIHSNNIVAIFQGRSEAGPRALGNRSILFNPTMEDGRIRVNEVKKREYWRPFAGVILHEDCDEWFDMARLDESPFMSYAINIKTKEKEKYIPCIVHNGTCRIQTLKKHQNPNLYEVITSFHSIKNNPPIIGNTSFNLAGDPIVETIDDAIDTLNRSKIEYLYLPENKEILFVEN